MFSMIESIKKRIVGLTLWLALVEIINLKSKRRISLALYFAEMQTALFSHDYYFYNSARRFASALSKLASAGNVESIRIFFSLYALTNYFEA